MRRLYWAAPGQGGGGRTRATERSRGAYFPWHQLFGTRDFLKFWNHDNSASRSDHPTATLEKRKTMAKRSAESSELETIKNGDRPMEVDQDEVEFEDEFEDEFESEDEILEAGVDGRPDDEREAEERESRFAPTLKLLGTHVLIRTNRCYGSRPRYFHSRSSQTLRW